MVKIAFVGMGSIGKRHLKNVCTYLEQKQRKFAIDVFRSGKTGALDPEILSKVDREIFMNDGYEIDENYDAVFITNPTAQHYATICRFVKVSKALFIEKPVFDKTEIDIESLGLRQDGIYYVACPLRYNPVIAYVRDRIPCEKAYSVRAISSSYLPDWRPGIDYRMCYSAHRDMGGGVDIDLIHEWDYLTHLFGYAEKGFAIRNQISDLEIDSYDVAIYIARTENTTIELHLDYFGRKSIRQMQIFLPDETVTCDLLEGTVRYEVSGERVCLASDRNSYQMAEIVHFFDVLDGKCANDSDIPNALRVLKYARGEF